MRILVTGATGFLGGYLTQALLSRGHELRVLARDPARMSSPWKDRVEVISGDVTDADAVDRAVRGVEAVFHLAAAVATRRSEREQARRTNETGTRNVVEASIRNPVRRLIHVSSVAAVGASEKPGELFNEQSPNPFRGSGFVNFDSKLAAEERVLDACRSSRLDAVVVNPSMVFGAGDAKKAARKGSVLAAQGKLPVYPPGGISVVAVEDVVEGMIQALSKGRSGERYILSGQNLSFKQVLRTYATLAGQKPPRLRLPRALLEGCGALSDFLALDVEMSSEAAAAASLFHWYDHSKASRELGFSPRPAEQAIRASLEWILGSGL